MLAACYYSAGEERPNNEVTPLFVHINRTTRRHNLSEQLWLKLLPQLINRKHITNESILTNRGCDNFQIPRVHTSHVYIATAFWWRLVTFTIVYDSFILSFGDNNETLPLLGEAADGGGLTVKFQIAITITWHIILKPVLRREKWHIENLLRCLSSKGRRIKVHIFRFCKYSKFIWIFIHLKIWRIEMFCYQSSFFYCFQ